MNGDWCSSWRRSWRSGRLFNLNCPEVGHSDMPASSLLTQQKSESSLDKLRLPRSPECFPVCSDNADFLPVEPCELYCLAEERVFVLLVVCGERVLVDDHHVFIFTAG